MSIDLGGPGELESADTVERIMSYYDAASGKWNLKANGRFWEAIKIAHKKKQMGRGTSIAILDGWYDKTIPHLRDRIRSQQVCDGASPTAMKHGTTVALLITAVAPYADLDFYGICDEYGRPQPGPLKHALKLATASDVTIINISAGRPRSWQQTLQLHRGLPSGYGLHEVQGEVFCREDCHWCGPVDEAASHDKIIVAAVGNNPQEVLCPARSPNVIATGFQTERRYLTSTDSETPYEVGEPDQPEGYIQSSEVAFTINQPKDAIGSSFGAPLLSGALALGIPSIEIPSWLKASQEATQAHYSLYSRAPIKQTASLLTSAWNKVPHDHFSESKPDPCFECSLFLEVLYTVECLIWLTNNVYDTADQRLKITQQIMPWSPHAFVNFGNLLERLATQESRSDTRSLIEEAIRYYEIALDCTPSSIIAAQRLAELQGSGLQRDGGGLSE